jgi:general secretion pathway protein D
LKIQRTAFLIVLTCLTLGLAACAGNPVLEEGRRLFAEGQPEAALARLEQGVRDKPDDYRLRNYYYRQREIYVAQLLAAGDAQRADGRAAEAEAAYRKVLKADPENARAKSGLALLAAQPRHLQMVKEAEALLQKGDSAGAEARVRAVLTENPYHVEARNLERRMLERAARREPLARVLKGPFSKPITLEFRDANLKSVFEVISRTSGVNFVFDKDVRPDLKVTIFVRNSSIDDVMKLILATNQLERKLLNDNSVLIYPNTPAKAKEYQDLVVKSFYLANADAKQALTLVRSMVKSRDVFVDEKLNLLVVRDTPDAVRLAEKLVESLDIADPEVMLEVEVMEVARTRLQELGLSFPNQVSFGLLTPNLQSTVITTTGTQTTTQLGGTLQPGFINLEEQGRRAIVPFVTNPALTLNLRAELGDSNVLANPRIRVKNKEKAKVHIGEKLPVFTTTSTANVGVSSSVTYLDVGLKLDVEPVVSLDDEVSIKIGLEVSSVVREVQGPQQSLAYQVGTRNAATVLRLKNGETQILAGLINDEERNSAAGLPGLSEIPILGRLFSSRRGALNKTEIVLLLTPRIIRNVSRPEGFASALPSGTDAAVGVAPLLLRPTAPGSLGLTPSPAGAAPAGAAGLPFRPRPEQPAPQPEPPVEPEPPQIALIAPSEAALRSEFPVTVLVSGANIRAAEMDIGYDANALELVGGATGSGGRARLSLTSSGEAGGPLQRELRFKVISQAARDTQLSVAVSAIQPSAGQPSPEAAQQVVKLVP